jgi:RNA polymerase sigma-70 factor (ECF subfamily)
MDAAPHAPASPAAFRAALAAFYPRLRRYARRLAPRAPDGDDLAHDTVVRALAQAHRFDGANLEAWLVTVCRRLWLDRVRRERATATLARDAAAAARSAPALPAQEAAVRLAEVAAQLATLCPHQHRIVLAHARGEDGAAIARATGTCAATVRSRLWRARRDLAARGCGATP